MQFKDKREADIYSEAYNKGVVSGREHSIPSPETLKQFKYMNNEITELKVNMQGVQKDILYIKEKVDESANNFYNFKKEIRDISDDKVNREEFIYWRNWGLKISVAVGIALVGLIVEMAMLIIQ